MRAPFDAFGHSHFGRKRRAQYSEDEMSHVLKSSVEAVLKYQGLGSTSILATVMEAWPKIVGERMSSHAVPSKIVGKELVVKVDHPAWATELRLMNSRIVTQLEELLKSPLINHLKVYVRPIHDID